MDGAVNACGTGDPVRRVFALVDLQSWGEEHRMRHVMATHASSLALQVSLSAEDGSGRRIWTAGRDMRISGPRTGIWHRWHGPPLPRDPKEVERITGDGHPVDVADIEDGINQLLGRDPTLHRPPRLAWGNLIRALAEAGIAVSEDDLIAAPLTIELSREVEAELESPPP
jgi:hypothetical protein